MSSVAKMVKKYWLMKSEPFELSIDDLKRKKREPWTGVRNFQARNFMRNEMSMGDLVIFYHSSAQTIGAAGIAKVVSLPHPDPTQFDKKSPYFDPKATTTTPVWYLVDVGFIRKFSRIITRDEMKRLSALKDSMLWTHNRLSIVPLTKKEFDAINGVL